MAKIGNEATLILKLAEERMEANKELHKESNIDFRRGYAQSIADNDRVIARIIADLQRPH